MRRVLLTAPATALAGCLAPVLRQRGEVEAVCGIDPGRRSTQTGDIELLPVDPDHRSLVALLSEQRIDTVIHCGMTPDRSGRPERAGPADVIATMRLCAAIGSSGAPVRSLVVVSSGAIYPVRTHMPLLQSEEGDTESGDREPESSLLEAEGYVRDLAARAPHICVAILRLAELAGGGLGGTLSALLARRVVPVPLGFDAPVQLLHGEDAASALAFAGGAELAGVYNVASRGVIRWSEAARTLRRRTVPVLPLETGPLHPLLSALRLPHLPQGTGPLLRLGSALDASKLGKAGWTAPHDQRDCLTSLRDRD